MRRDGVDDVVAGEDASSRLEHVYRQHGQTVWRAVVAFSGDPEVASDAVSEAFAQALRRGDAIATPLPWIWTTALRLAAGAMQERRRYGPGDRSLASYEIPESVRDLVVALGHLSDRQRASVLLHHYAGYPVADVARMIGSTPAAVRVHLHRGRGRLRTLLGDEDD